MNATSQAQILTHFSVAVRRKDVLLAPPTAEDLVWIIEQLERPEVFGPLGYSRPAGARMAQMALLDRVGIAVMIELPRSARIGFAQLHPPRENEPDPEFAFAIVDAQARNGRLSVDAADAAAHYVFDLAKGERLAFKVNPKNKGSTSVIRKLGYKPQGRTPDGRYERFVVDRARWARRKADLTTLDPFPFTTVDIRYAA